MSSTEEGHGCMDDKDMNLDFCGDLFDHIDDLLDFPAEDIQGGGDILVGGDCVVSHNTNGGFHGVWQSPPVDACSPLFSNPNNHSAFPTDLSVPDEDIAQLEWLSTFVEDSFSAGTITLNEDFVRTNNNNNNNHQKKLKKNNSNINDDDDNNNNNSDIHQFRTPSPVSVLESSSSSSGGRTMLISPETVVPGRARNQSMSAHPMAIRKCLHCEITKTPQWRAGPLGPKTLCNACGVRYKSGRLFPEYRPAASPTFVPKLHSNSHKKVLEMRNKTDFELSSDEMDEPVTEFLPGFRIWNEYM
ncbi:hypothetical protein IFM89_009429 [Coptis chinensis]|uniref:GATA transcription factor n=1 Tax=Coptis chinensis TaxID=261450 RepID=A0A835ID40_9MAGN|nr:hypothetical protein IFM89_009429 [Coptis chinensis]